MSIVPRPHTYTPNTTISSSQANANEDTLYNDYNGNISAANLATDAVTTAKIADSNVTTAKINDSAVTTAKINNDAVTAAKIDWASTGANGGIWWEELGRTTLSGAGDTITVSGLPARKYLQIRYTVFDTGGAVGSNIRFNGDTGNNYAYTYSLDGAAATTGASQSSIFFRAGTQAAAATGVMEVFNIATDEKPCVGQMTTNNAAGAGTVPNGGVISGKWVNTSDQITEVSLINVGAGDYAIGSEVVVLGHN